jgi:hypothetical protein
MITSILEIYVYYVPQTKFERHIVFAPFLIILIIIILLFLSFVLRQKFVRHISRCLDQTLWNLVGIWFCFFGLSRSTRCGCCFYQVSSISVWRVTCYDHFCVFISLAFWLQKYVYYVPQTKFERHIVFAPFLIILIIIILLFLIEN